MWLPLLKRMGEGSHSADGREEQAEVILNRGFLVWGDAANQRLLPFWQQAVDWPWTGDRQQQSLGFCRSPVGGVSVLVPLIDLPSRASACASWDLATLTGSQEHGELGANLELLLGSHTGDGMADEVNLASIPLSAGDLLLLDNRAWRRLRMHTHGFSGRCLLLVYEYTTTSAESLSSAPDATYWSAAAWLLRLRRAAGALRATLPWHET
ncbi:unnamed protein product [Effrenium voratum]|nr:unnamed protein product [Effrenium voratum]